jgi:hypothetical protein
VPAGGLAQLNTPSPPALAARDTTAATSEWTLSLLADQRSFYLGREYGGHALSLAPSLNCSHRSGLYDTVGGYYFQQSQPPRYSFTNLELGYANDFTNSWTYSFSYNRVFFTPPTSAINKLIPNGLEAYTAYQLGPLQAAVDYNFFFGKSSAQTITLALSSAFKKDDWLSFAEVSLTPEAQVLWGSPLALACYGGTYTATSTAAAKQPPPKAPKSRPKQCVCSAMSWRCPCGPSAARWLTPWLGITSYQAAPPTTQPRPYPLVHI